MAVLPAILALGQTGFGIYQQMKGQRALKEAQANRPTYEIPESLKKAMLTSELDALRGGLPEEVKSQMLQQMDRSRAASLAQISERRGGLGITPMLEQQSQDAMNQMATMDAQAREKKLMNLQNMRLQMAQQEQAKWKYDEAEQYREGIAQGQAMTGAGMQNIFGGMTSIATMAAADAFPKLGEGIRERTGNILGKFKNIFGGKGPNDVSIADDAGTVNFEIGLNPNTGTVERKVNTGTDWVWKDSKLTRLPKYEFLSDLDKSGLRGRLQGLQNISTNVQPEALSEQFTTLDQSVNPPFTAQDIYGDVNLPSTGNIPVLPTTEPTPTFDTYDEYVENMQSQRLENQIIPEDQWNENRSIYGSEEYKQFKGDLLSQYQSQYPDAYEGSEPPESVIRQAYMESINQTVPMDIPSPTIGQYGGFPGPTLQEQVGVNPVNVQNVQEETAKNLFPDYQDTGIPFAQAEDVVNEGKKLYNNPQNLTSEEKEGEEAFINNDEFNAPDSELIIPGEDFDSAKDKLNIWKQGVKQGNVTPSFEEFKELHLNWRTDGKYKNHPVWNKHVQRKYNEFLDEIGGNEQYKANYINMLASTPGEITDGQVQEIKNEMERFANTPDVSSEQVEDLKKSLYEKPNDLTNEQIEEITKNLYTGPTDNNGNPIDNFGNIDWESLDIVPPMEYREAPLYFKSNGEPYERRALEFFKQMGASDLGEQHQLFDKEGRPIVPNKDGYPLNWKDSKLRLDFNNLPKEEQNSIILQYEGDMEKYFEDLKKETEESENKARIENYRQQMHAIANYNKPVDLLTPHEVETTLMGVNGNSALAIAMKNSQAYQDLKTEGTGIEFQSII